MGERGNGKAAGRMNGSLSAGRTVTAVELDLHQHQVRSIVTEDDDLHPLGDWILGGQDIDPEQEGFLDDAGVRADADFGSGDLPRLMLSGEIQQLHMQTLGK